MEEIGQVKVICRFCNLRVHEKCLRGACECHCRNVER